MNPCHPFHGTSGRSVFQGAIACHQDTSTEAQLFVEKCQRHFAKIYQLYQGKKNRKRYPKQPVFTVNGWMFGDLQPFPYIKICFIIIQLIANHIFQQMVIRFQVAVCRIHHRFVEDFCLVQEFQWLRQLCQHLSKDFLRFVIFGTVNGCWLVAKNALSFASCCHQVFFFASSPHGTSNLVGRHFPQNLDGLQDQWTKKKEL